MDKDLAYCGYRCDRCAARSSDPAVRAQLVEGWRRIFGHQMYTVDNVLCVGCRNEGHHADTSCEARPCAMEKGVESCALCADFPCKKVGGLVSSREGLLVFCGSRCKDLSEEDYNLCMRQFDSLPELLRVMVEAGKLPAWAKDEKD